MKFAAILSVFLGTILLASIATNAAPWKIDASLNLTTGVNSYSDNWEGGEAGSFTWTSQFLGVAEKQFTKLTNSKTTLKLQFGQTAVQDKETKHWSAPQKSTDLIDGEELFRLTLASWVDPFISLRVISEFLDGSDTLFTRYGNPLDITEAVGASRTLVKNEYVEWAARLGGAARQLVDRHHLDTATGLRATDLTEDEGLEFNTDLAANNKAKWVTLLSSLRVYEALVSSKANAAKGTPEADYWKYPHVKWENTLTLRFAKYLMLNLSAYLYYDKPLSTEMRLKESCSAGLMYVFTKK
jgi:hypothetical protein